MTPNPSILCTPISVIFISTHFVLESTVISTHHHDYTLIMLNGMLYL